MSLPEPVTAYGIWIVVGLMLAIAEILIPGIFLIWLGGAALITGLVTALFDPPPAMQFATFAVIAVATVLGGRRWIAAHPPRNGDPMLNDRLARLIGEPVIVVEALQDGFGRVRVGDGVWNACGPDAAVGSAMHVVGHDQGRLVVARSR